MVLDEFIIRWVRLEKRILARDHLKAENVTSCATEARDLIRSGAIVGRMNFHSVIKPEMQRVLVALRPILDASEKIRINTPDRNIWSESNLKAALTLYLNGPNNENLR